MAGPRITSASRGPRRRVDRLPRNSRARDGENQILSKCSLIVPTDPSSFLGIAAQRAAASDDSVRAAMACPATSPMASPFSATGDPCPCFFAARCPAPGSNFSRQLVHYGFAPDTGRASKHHSYEDHGSKPECPGLHEGS